MIFFRSIITAPLCPETAPLLNEKLTKHSAFRIASDGLDYDMGPDSGATAQVYIRHLRFLYEAVRLEYECWNDRENLLFSEIKNHN